MTAAEHAALRAGQRLAYEALLAAILRAPDGKGATLDRAEARTGLGLADELVAAAGAYRRAAMIVAEAVGIDTGGPAIFVVRDHTTSSPSPARGAAPDGPVSPIALAPPEAAGGRTARACPVCGGPTVDLGGGETLTEHEASCANA